MLLTLTRSPLKFFFFRRVCDIIEKLLRDQCPNYSRQETGNRIKREVPDLFPVLKNSVFNNKKTQPRRNPWGFVSERLRSNDRCYRDPRRTSRPCQKNFNSTEPRRDPQARETSKRSLGRQADYSMRIRAFLGTLFSSVTLRGPSPNSLETKSRGEVGFPPLTLTLAFATDTQRLDTALRATTSR